MILKLIIAKAAVMAVLMVFSHDALVVIAGTVNVTRRK